MVNESEKSEEPLVEHADEFRETVPNQIEEARVHFLTTTEVREKLFEEKTNETFRALEVEAYINKLEESLKRLADLAEGKEKISQDEKNEQFWSGLKNYQTKLKEEVREPFGVWIERQKTDPKSILGQQYREMRIAEYAQETLNELEKLPLESILSSINPKISKRLDGIKEQVKQISESVKMEEAYVLQEFFIAATLEETLEEPKQGFWQRFLGPSQKERFDSEEETRFNRLVNHWLPINEKTLDETEKESNLRSAVLAANSARFRNFGNKERLRTQEEVESARKEKIGEKLGKIRRLIDGEVEIFEDEPVAISPKGLEAYKEKHGLTDRIDSAIAALLPILGRDFVPRVEFQNNQKDNKGNDNTAGDFNPNTHEIRIFQHLDPIGDGADVEVDVIRTLYHETGGHALRIEETLSLAEAIRFGIELAETISASGFITDYSEQAKEIYRDKVARAIMEADIKVAFLSKRTTRELNEVIENAPLSEEWAEMVAYTSCSPMMRIIHPEKAIMVEKYLRRFGLDSEKMRQAVSSKKVVN